MKYLKACLTSLGVVSVGIVSIIMAIDVKTYKYNEIKVPISCRFRKVIISPADAVYLGVMPGIYDPEETSKLLLGAVKSEIGEDSEIDLGSRIVFNFILNSAKQSFSEIVMTTVDEVCEGENPSINSTLDQLQMFF